MTGSVQSVVQRSPLGELWRHVQRERALIALFDFGRQRTLGLRTARLYAFGVFVSYAIAISLSHGRDQRALIQGFVRAALVALSWVVGALAALGTAQALARSGERAGLVALALERGFSRPALLRACTLAAARRIALLVGVPALLLVGVALARGCSLAWALVTVPGVAVYASALGLALALLAQFSAQLAPRHPRSLLLALALGPLLVAQAYPAVPSLPDLFATLLGRLLAAGARVS